MRLSFKVLMSVTTGLIFAAGFLSMGQAFAQQTAPVVTASAQVDAETFQKEIERLKKEKAEESLRVEQMRTEREQFVKEVRRVENLNTKYTKEIESLRGEMASQQQVFEGRMNKMESDVKDSVEVKKVAPLAQAPSILPIEVEKKANDVLSKGGDLDPEDEKFKEELARAHYNMGNVYFERGEYQRAVVEYYQAVDLMPYDADAHYNLAFVSGEFVGDQETALKHYQWYLYLKPNAEDKKLVEEKMVTAKLNTRGQVNSKVNVTELTGHTNVAR